MHSLRGRVRLLIVGLTLSFGLVLLILFQLDALPPADGLLRALLVGAVALLGIVGIAGWALSRTMVEALHALADQLRTPGEPCPTLDRQPFAEFEAINTACRELTRRVEDGARDGADALRAEQAQTAAVIESIDDGVIMLDASGVVVHVNEIAGAILGIERAQLLHATFDDLDTGQPHYLGIRGAVRQFIAAPREVADRVELTLFLRGRDHHYLLRSIALRGRDEAPAGLVLLLQDVTYTRDQPAQREHWLATLSHELDSPLTSLRQALELLARDRAHLDVQQRAVLETVQEDISRLEQLANRTRDLSRTQATSIALERRSVDLCDVIDRMIRIFLPQAREKGVTLDAVMAEGGLSVTGDPTKLTWALSNLLSNALRYTPPGGRVHIEATTEAQAVLVSVSDTGSGIAPDQQERIFQRGVQSAESVAAGSEGLGLAIVRDIVEAHGGRILLDSEVGRGSRFTLQLPRG